MTSLTNLDRDMKWIGTPQDLALPSTLTDLDAPNVRTDGVLNTTHGYMQSDVFNLGGTAGKFRSFGLYMQWQSAGTQPFRCKGHSTSDDTVWGVGWNSTVDTEEAASNIRYLGVGKKFDELVALRELASWSNEQLLFFCMVPADAGWSVCGLSVQRLLGKPDQYSSQVR